MKSLFVENYVLFGSVFFIACQKMEEEAEDNESQEEICEDEPLFLSEEVGTNNKIQYLRQFFKLPLKPMYSTIELVIIASKNHLYHLIFE